MSTDTRTTTAANTSTLSTRAIGALVGGRGEGTTVGLTTIDLETTACACFQFTDTASYPRTAQLLVKQKAEQVLIPEKRSENYSALYELLMIELPNIEFIPISRSYFCENKGLSYIRRYAFVQDQETFPPTASSDTYYGLTSVGGLFSYFENNQRMIFPENSLSFTFSRCPGGMLIDSVTIENLELIKNSFDPNSKKSLFGVLDYTLTPMGKRLLRANLCQPMSDEPTIQARLDCIQELRDTEGKLTSFRKELSKLPDINRILTSISSPRHQLSIKLFEEKVKIVIDIRNLLSTVQCIIPLIADLSSVLFKAISDVLSNPKLENIYNFTNERINEKIDQINENSNINNLKAYVIKDGLNSLLDVARRAYTENIEDTIKLIEEYKEKYGMKFRLVKATQYGFNILLNSQELKGRDIPDIFIGSRKKTKTISLKTIDLEKLNERIKNALDEVYLMSESICQEIIDEFRKHIQFIHKLTEALSILDLTCSLTILSIRHGYVRPEFSKSLLIKEGRHPVMESLTKDYIPNLVYSDCFKKLTFIMGPNMSGKTTYLKMIGVIVVMAHIGSYVPADFAYIRLTDTLLTQFGSGSNYQEGSSFYKELMGTSRILKNNNGQALFLFDELGRGTSSIDGLAMSYAVCEDLLKAPAFIFFSTHFQELPIYMKAYPGVTVLTMKVDEDSREGKHFLRYTHSAREGFTVIKNYGIKLAEKLSMPKEIIVEALKISDKITDLTQTNIEEIEIRFERQHKNVISDVKTTVSQIGQTLYLTAQESELGPKELAEFINHLKARHAGVLRAVVENEDF